MFHGNLENLNYCKHQSDLVITEFLIAALAKGWSKIQKGTETGEIRLL